MYDLGTPLTLGFCLSRNSPDHGFIQIHVLYFHVDNLNAPFFRLDINNFLNISIELVTLRQHFIKIMLAKYGSQGGLCKLAGGQVIVFNPDNRSLRVHYPEVEYGVYPNGYVVFGDNVLAGHIQSDYPKIYPGELLNSGDYDYQARAFNALKTPQEKDNTPLILRYNFKGSAKNQQKHHYGCKIGNQFTNHTVSLFCGYLLPDRSLALIHNLHGNG